MAGLVDLEKEAFLPVLGRAAMTLGKKLIPKTVTGKVMSGVGALGNAMVIKDAAKGTQATETIKKMYTKTAGLKLPGLSSAFKIKKPEGLSNLGGGGMKPSMKSNTINMKNMSSPGLGSKPQLTSKILR